MIKSKIQLYKVPILTPTVLTMLEMENNINYIDSGSDLLIRWQVITNFLMELLFVKLSETKLSIYVTQKLLMVFGNLVIF